MNMYIDTIRKHKEKFVVIMVFLGFSILFLFKSPVHPWIQKDLDTDRSVFKLISWQMSMGYVPYKDTFDHKGPLLYFINYIGYLISAEIGGFWIETGVILITLIYIYKIARLKCGPKLSLFISLLSFSPMFSYYDGGGFPEEYALPMISISLYIFLDYFINKKVRKIKVFFCGFSFCAVCLLKINLISVWIVFCLVISVKCIVARDTRKLLGFAGAFIAGVLTLLMPVILWLYNKNALTDFWKDYIVFNTKYSSDAAGWALYYKKWNAFFVFLNNPVLLAGIIICILFAVNKQYFYIAYLCYMLLTVYLAAMAGRDYPHYQIVFIPMFAYPLSSAAESIGAVLGDKKKREIVALLVTMVLSIVYILPDWFKLSSSAGKIYEERDLRKDTYNDDLIAFIRSNTSDSDRISVYGNWDLIYVDAQRFPASKYSYQSPIGGVDPEILEQYFEDLEENDPKLIVIQDGFYDERMDSFLNNNEFTLQWERMGLYGDPVYVYGR